MAVTVRLFNGKIAGLKAPTPSNENSYTLNKSSLQPLNKSSYTLNGHEGFTTQERFETKPVRPRAHRLSVLVNRLLRRGRKAMSHRMRLSRTLCRLKPYVPAC